MMHVARRDLEVIAKALYLAGLSRVSDLLITESWDIDQCYGWLDSFDELNERIHRHLETEDPADGDPA